MSQDDALRILGQLAQQARAQFQPAMSRKGLAAKAGVNVRTLMTFEDGGRRVSALNAQKLENALNWAPGSIAWVLNLPPERLASLVLRDLKDWANPDSRQDSDVLRAEHLSDDELITELTRRFRNYAIAASEKPNVSLRSVPDWRDSITSQGEVDLAAAPRSKSEKLRFEHSDKVGEESQDYPEGE